MGKLFTHVPLSPSNIRWYDGLKAGKVTAVCGRGVAYRYHITELCLQLTAGSGPCKRRWAPTLQSQSCEIAMLTMGTFLKAISYATSICSPLLFRFSCKQTYISVGIYLVYFIYIGNEPSWKEFEKNLGLLGFIKKTLRKPLKSTF